MTELRGMIAVAGIELAYAHLAGRAPTLVFLPGFASDMEGGKAVFLRDWCAARGQAMLRLDYSGHGASAGRFADGTIGRWTADARAVIEAVVPNGPILLAGSSMGGWIGLLLLRALGHRVSGFIGIAPAPDFTEDLMKPALPPAALAALARDGVAMLPSTHGSPTPLTSALLDDGARHLVLRAPIPFAGPVRLIQGQRDTDVPWQTSLRLAERFTGDDVHVTLIKDGEHRLSRDTDLAVLAAAVAALSPLAEATGP